MPPRALTPLRNRSLRLLLAGQVASNVGDACYAVALPWYVLAAHGGTTLLGVVLVAYVLPRTCLILAGGWASDRWGSRSVMMVTDLARVVGAAALAAVATSGPAHAALLIPIAVVLGAGEGLFLPASNSVIPSLVPSEDLQAANGLVSSGTQLALLAGPALGGVLVALGGPSFAFALDAASFAVSAATLARLRAGQQVAPSAGDPAEDAEDAPSMSTFALFRSQRVLQVTVLLTIVLNLGSDGVTGVALPALAHGPLHSGAGGYGLILAAVGAGALLGAVGAGQVRQPRRPAVVATIAFQIAYACILITPFLGNAVGVAAAMAVNGLMVGFGNVLCFAALQRSTPPALLGRVTGLVLTGVYGVAPLSVALAAIFTRDLGNASFFLFAGIAGTAAIAYGLSQKPWREFGTHQLMDPDPISNPMGDNPASVQGAAVNPQ